LQTIGQNTTLPPIIKTWELNSWPLSEQSWS
jgi:hypothetical protein